MNKDTFFRAFPLGSHLCREPMPPINELKKDMENLKRHGFNLIKIQEHWMTDEPLEGYYDFSRYEELIAHAAFLDMGVYIGLTCEQAPGWLYRKYPDCRMVGRNGLPIIHEAQMTLPSDGKPGPCYDHPGAMADQQRFIRKLVEVLGKYENVVIWNTWQEVAYWAERLVGQPVCYCSHTLAHFRRWLAEKYGDLDGLNRAWKTRYLDWSYVQPDRGAYGRSALPQDIDWQYFMTNVQIAHILRTRAQTIREADPWKRPIFCHKAFPAIGSGHDWVYARCQDFLGSSCYPAWAPFHGWDDYRRQSKYLVDPSIAWKQEMLSVALTFDYLRSCNQPGHPCWAAEFQGGPISTGFHKGRVPSREDIRRWMLMAVACGVTGICFWVTRAEIMADEINGFSLLDSAGDTTERYEEASRIGQALNRYPTLFNTASLCPAEVAIMVDEWNYQFCQSMTQGGEHLSYSVRGWHRLLWDLGIPVDFIEASQLNNLSKKSYKAIIVPFPLSMSDGVAQQLIDYVDHGGNLICEAAPGRVNEHGYAQRGEMSPILANFLGAKHKNFTMVSEPNGDTRWSPEPRTWGEYKEATQLVGVGPLMGHRIQANVYLQTFELLHGKPCLLCDEEIAGVVHNTGKGSAWLLGTYLGHSGTAYIHPDNHRLVQQLLAQCGVYPSQVGSLCLRKRRLNHQEAWFLINFGSQAVTETISIPLSWEVENLLGNPFQWKDDHTITLTVNPCDIEVLILFQ